MCNKKPFIELNAYVMWARPTSMLGCTLPRWACSLASFSVPRPSLGLRRGKATHIHSFGENILTTYFMLKVTLVKYEHSCKEALSRNGVASLSAWCDSRIKWLHGPGQLEPNGAHNTENECQDCARCSLNAKQRRCNGRPGSKYAARP